MVIIDGRRSEKESKRERKQKNDRSWKRGLSGAEKGESRRNPEAWTVDDIWYAVFIRDSVTNEEEEEEEEEDEKEEEVRNKVFTLESGGPQYVVGTSDCRIYMKSDWCAATIARLSGKQQLEINRNLVYAITAWTTRKFWWDPNENRLPSFLFGENMCDVAGS